MIQKKPIRLVFLSILMFCCLGASGTLAAPLGLSLSSPIFNGFIKENQNTLTYFPSNTSSFHAHGRPFLLTLEDGTPIPVSDITMELTPDLDASGQIIGSREVLFWGTVPNLMISTPSPLLIGELNAFGFAAFSPFEFTFTITGGELSPRFGGMGTQGGIIIPAIGFNGSLSDDYTNYNLTTFDVGLISSVPIPSAILLLFSGVLAMVGYLRK